MVFPVLYESEELPMSKYFRSLAIAASLAFVLCGSVVAQAAHVRNSIDRHQHPERGFFEKSAAHHHATNLRQAR